MSDSIHEQRSDEEPYNVGFFVNSLLRRSEKRRGTADVFEMKKAREHTEALETIDQGMQREEARHPCTLGNDDDL